MKYQVMRVSPEGYKGYKYFNTLEEAATWLESDAVKEDKSYGFFFELSPIDAES